MKQAEKIGRPVVPLSTLQVPILVLEQSVVRSYAQPKWRERPQGADYCHYYRWLR